MTRRGLVALTASLQTLGGGFFTAESIAIASPSSSDPYLADPDHPDAVYEDEIEGALRRGETPAPKAAVLSSPPADRSTPATTVLRSAG